MPLGLNLSAFNILQRLVYCHRQGSTAPCLTVSPLRSCTDLQHPTDPASHHRQAQHVPKRLHILRARPRQGLLVLQLGETQPRLFPPLRLLLPLPRDSSRSCVVQPRGHILSRMRHFKPARAKKEIKRVAKTREKIEQDLRDAVARQDEEAQKRAVQDFELIQAGHAPSSSSTKSAVKDSAADQSKREVDAAATDSGPQPVGKRKLVLDEEAVENIAREDRAKARKLLDEETVGHLKLERKTTGFFDTDHLPRPARSSPRSGHLHRHPAMPLSRPRRRSRNKSSPFRYAPPRKPTRSTPTTSKVSTQSISQRRQTRRSPRLRDASALPA